VDLAFIPPGEPWKNGYVESFHSRQRDELLNITTLPSLLHARAYRAERLAPRIQPRPKALQPRLQDTHRIR